MALKAAFFDVGDTLVEGWIPADAQNERTRAQICAALGDPPEWLDGLLGARIEPDYPLSLAQSIAARTGGELFAPEFTKQETERWYRAWSDAQGIDLDIVGFERLRALLCLPLEEIASPVPGAFEAIRWCAERGLRVVLVTNTNFRGDDECLEDMRRFGLDDAVHAIVSSHSAGWRKPHPAIFQRALEAAGAGPEEAFHVGDNVIADVFGARQLGIRAVWRRTPDKALLGRRHDPREAAADIECRHPSDRLSIDGEAVVCGSCGAEVSIDVRADAIVDDLTELPRVVEPWLDGPVR